MLFSYLFIYIATLLGCIIIFSHKLYTRLWVFFSLTQYRVAYFIDNTPTLCYIIVFE